jgi:putative DNA primase/helicase
MTRHEHWLPQLIVKADKYNNAAVNFLQSYILDQVVRGRVHPEINPHRGEQGGTRSLRFSYSNPPLQLMPAHNEELAPLIRGVFLPEEGEVWAKPDLSQQEFRFVCHYAARHNLSKAREAVERYRHDPATDFHRFVSEMTGIERQSAKNTNFAKVFGAGVRKFAQMIFKPENEARVLYERYDNELPFVSELAKLCQRAARRDGFLTLYDGARRHFDKFAPGGKWSKGLGPCEEDEAIRRVTDPNHPWYRRQLWRSDVHKALNALIQGSAARHTKLWMLACWREGIVPLLQMHDSLDCSISSPEQAEIVARLGCEAVTLEVPMKVELAYGRNWGDAKHTWEELHTETSPHVELAGELPDDRERTRRERPKFPNDFHKAPQGEPMLAAANAANDPPLPPPQPSPSPPKDKPTANGNGRGDFTGFSYQSGEDEPRDASEEPNEGESSKVQKGSPAAEYLYMNAQNRLYMKVVKWVWFKAGKRKKSYPTYRWDPGNGAWVKEWPEKILPYRLPELLAASANARVVICEGEDNAERVAALGFIATTNPGGAGKWRPELNKWLTGFGQAIVLEDNDEAGRKHVSQVATSLRDTISDIRVLTFRELPEHGDVADWLKAGGTREQFLERIEQAPKFAVLESVCAAEVEIEDFDWVWPDRFALRKIGLIAGLPDEGKGQLLSDIIARITRGAAWPCNEGNAPLGNVILFTAEDDIKDTITPRLLAANADLQRVTIIKMMHEAGKPRMFSLISDLEILREKVIEIGNVKMVVIDPVSAYLGIGKVDSFRATDVRAVLGPLKELAEDMGLAILGIMHFNKKIDITNLLLRISDSLAYGAAARHVYGVVNDPDNQRKLFVRGKNNIAKAEQKTLGFSFAEREVGSSKKTGKPIHAPYIVWDTTPIDITATEALQAAAESKSPSARDTAKDFIVTLLNDGPVDSSEVLKAVEANGISKTTLNRARKDLGPGLAIRQDGPIVDGHRTWRWCLVRPEAEV